MNKRTVGSEKELLAARALEKEGYEILARNFTCRMGEIDIVAKDGDYLVFCEVKFRKRASEGMPMEAVTVAKQKKITLAASFYLTRYRLPFDTPVRFDVISILGENISIIKNAFEAAEI